MKKKKTIKWKGGQGGDDESDIREDEFGGKRWNSGRNNINYQKGREIIIEIKSMTQSIWGQLNEFYSSLLKRRLYPPSLPPFLSLSLGEENCDGKIGEGQRISHRKGIIYQEKNVGPKNLQASILKKKSIGFRQSGLL